MEKYLSAVSEMYSQFKKKEAHPMERYIGKHVVYLGEIREVVGYTLQPVGPFDLIVDASGAGGWMVLGPHDVIFKECGDYRYAISSDVID